MILIHFDWFCALDPERHCFGKRILQGPNPTTICFTYDENRFYYGPKSYFTSFPILRFHLKNAHNNSQTVYLNWYPSEYLYREKTNQYCLAAESSARSNEVMMGGTLLRQNNMIFDIDNNLVGIARAQCNEDPN